MGAGNSKSSYLKAEKELAQWGLTWLRESPIVDAKYTTEEIHFEQLDINVMVNGEEGIMHCLHYWTDLSAADGAKPPLILLHGYSQSAAQFYLVAPAIAADYQGHVYALDNWGCGASTRAAFNGSFDGEEETIMSNEHTFIEALESWRTAMGIEQFVLAAHSMGAYLSVRYAQHHAKRLQKLVLLSPVGIPERKESMSNSNSSMPWWMRLAMNLWNKGYGPFNVARATPGQYLANKYCFKRYPDRSWVPKTLLANQLHVNWSHSNISIGGYSHALFLLPGAYARRPLIKDLPDVIHDVGHVTFVYGQSDWMSIEAAQDVIQKWTAQYAPQRRSPRLKKPHEAEESDETTCIGLFRVQSAGHAFLVDNPLGTAQGIMEALSVSGTQREIVDVGAEYFALDRAVESDGENHHRNSANAKKEDLPTQPGKRFRNFHSGPR
jgi:pimeloyl-ACP methyl ester carboxylesterase